MRYIARVILKLFGIFTVTMLHFMDIPNQGAVGPGILVVAGGSLITYSVLTMETHRKYGANKIRVALSALAIGLVLFLFLILTGSSRHKNNN